MREEAMARIAANATAEGYSEAQVEGFDQVFHKRKFMLSRFGLVDSVVTVRSADAVTGADLESYEGEAFRAALSLKTKLPRGVFSAVELFPVVVAGSADESAVARVTGVVKNRWSAIAMHALIHGDPPSTVVFEGRKIWGAAYIRGLRERLQRIVA